MCFCTLAIHAPYRERARQLCLDVAPAPMVVLTDEPSDFAGLDVEVIPHKPTGPMAVDYRAGLLATGNHRGAAAYHDKRFALRAALWRHPTAVFLDADSRFDGPAPVFSPPPGIAVTRVVERSVAVHLQHCGTWRQPAFEALAWELTGSPDILHHARWIHEACFAVTRDGRENAFFEAWDRLAISLQRRGVHSGEGGVIGFAAALVGWAVDYEKLARLAVCVRHEGGGPDGHR